jgi:hypothetical protein
MLWAVELAKVIGAIRAGSLAERCDIYGADAGDLQQWYTAHVHGIGLHADFQRTYVAAWQVAERWYQHSGVQRAISAVANALLAQGETSRYALHSIFEHCQVWNIPTPMYAPILPAVTTRCTVTPAATSRKTATPLSSQRRPVGTAGVDLHNFGRDKNGRIRPFTQAEWAFVAEHGLEGVQIQSIRPFSAAELETVVEYMEDAVARQHARGLARR